MPITPNRGYSWPVVTDPATVPADMARFLQPIDADVQTVVDEQGVLTQRVSDASEAADAARASAEETRALDEVKRITITSSTVVDTAGWDRDRAHVLVVTQDTVGGRTLMHDGGEVWTAQAPGAATVTAWVWDGASWVWRSSEPEPVPTEAPAWVPGTTVKVVPAHDHATVTFSQPVPARATVQWRAGESDSWRTLTMSTSTSGTISGLTPTTTYPAPDFQAVNVIGSSTVISADGFTTLAKPLAWEVTHRASFNTDQETPISSYTPELGGQLTIANGDKANVVAVDGHTEVRYTTVNYPNVSASWPVTWGDKNLRVVCTYSGADTAGRAAQLNIGTDKSASFAASLQTGNITTSRAAELGGAGAAATETTGNQTLPPASGTAVLTADGDVFTLTIDGQLYRRWEVTWGTNYGAINYYTSGGCRLGGGDIHPGNTVSGLTVDELRIERFQ